MDNIYNLFISIKSIIIQLICQRAFMAMQFSFRKAYKICLSSNLRSYKDIVIANKFVIHENLIDLHNIETWNKSNMGIHQQRTINLNNVLIEIFYICKTVKDNVQFVPI